MKLPFTLILVCLSLAQFSCKKDPGTDNKMVTPGVPVAPATSQTLSTQIDTVKPLSYLPVYPGSYWKYSNNVTTTVSSTYVKDVYTIITSPFTTTKSDTAYVPIYKGLPVWGYLGHDEREVGGQAFIRIVSDSLPVGSEWMTFRDSHITSMARIISVNATITISGQNYFPTIVVYKYSALGGIANAAQYSREKHYYTKNIGLVKSEFLSDADSSVITQEVHLLNYLIND